MSDIFRWCQDKTKLSIWDKQVFLVNWNGSKIWYMNGYLHRENGPAVERSNGYKSWWLNDICYSESDYWKELSK